MNRVLLRTTFLSVALTVSLSACISADTKDNYKNPVVNYSLPDPTVIKGEDGKFYLFATEDIHNVPILVSDNLVDWSQIGTAFTDETRPSFVENGGIWAPDINYVNGKYQLYYSMSVWGGEWNCGIGVAVADTPKGKFTDKGMLFRSSGIGVQNCIDPFYIEDEGKKYLFFGSFSGIYGVELSEDGLSVKSDKPIQIAGNAYEGTYIHKRNGYYYLFASIGTCCEGINSTYTMVVGRSRSLFGPYLNKDNKPMMTNNHEILVQRNDAFVGTGHNSEIVSDDAGNDWIFYHGVRTSAPSDGRVLLLDRVTWLQDWPEVSCGTPSLESECPIFK